MRILHLDDDRGILKATERLLRRHHTVDGATDLSAAIGMIEANQYDLVISDYDLKNDETGLDLLMWIRAHNKGLKFLFLSANSYVWSVTLCQLGVPFVEKPCHIHELLAAIEEATRPTFEPSLPDRPHIDDPSDGRGGGASQ